MIKNRFFVLVSFASLVATPVVAQENGEIEGANSVDARSAAEETAPAAELRYTPEDDLNCALYTSMLLGMMGDGALESQQGSGILAGLAYFLGRWEAARGGDLTQALTDQYPAFLAVNGQALAQSCGERMQRFGGEMQVAGAALIALEEQARAPQSIE